MKKLLSLLSLLTAGCGPCEQVSLTPDERAWFPAHPAGKQIFFRSNRGNANTMTLIEQREWHTNTNCNKLEEGAYQPIHVQFGLNSATQYDPKRPYFSITADKTRPDRPARLQLSMAGLDYPLPSGQKIGPTDVLVQEPCTLRSGKAYLAAYVFRDGQNAKNYGTGRLRAFYWDKQDGLIRYDLADGEVFERVAN
ncbi:hypothetical protein MON38_09275 [Hymenobacter sp. DH14]|uniref:Lipoprotein n=1 Tax=Hymenobacter cyanobacteriorum TaxID=2926463 RepID=A0A9X1VIH8_9BACT|nr:hypothetical protein [Hymenobacter cyanobacteriorum]MCI1187610.1 hypothetical protein [Hymenobacter cyanobacteriorum]